MIRYLKEFPYSVKLRLHLFKGHGWCGGWLGHRASIVGEGLGASYVEMRRVGEVREEAAPSESHRLPDASGELEESTRGMSG